MGNRTEAMRGMGPDIGEAWVLPWKRPQVERPLAAHQAAVNRTGASSDRPLLVNDMGTKCERSRADPMSDATQAKLFPAVDPALIRDFLRAEPDFLHGDPDLLNDLGLRPDASNIVDFGPAALARISA